jgi:transposase
MSQQPNQIRFDLVRQQTVLLRTALFVAVVIVQSSGFLPSSFACQVQPVSSENSESVDTSNSVENAAKYLVRSTNGALRGTYLVKLKSGKKYAGRIENETATQLIMTRRNGRIALIDPDDIEERKKVEAGFTPKTPHQLRAELQKEFGSKYEVSLTRHFVIVHPPGDYQKWAMPFEELYERFKNQLRSRGKIIDEPEFPLVAIVLRTAKEFDRMGAKKGFSSRTVAGYYAFHSNRLIAYQQDVRWRDAKEDWIETLDTIVHEAVHQTAANSGIHSRIYPNPLWVAEGLATVFEAKGINNYFKYSDFKSRINYDRCERLKHYYKAGNMEGQIASMIATDEVFRRSPDKAYAMAWGLSFYLSQNQPHLYTQYLEKLQDHEKTSSLTSGNRIKYFEQTFGPIKRMELQLEGYVKGLPSRND